MRDEFIGNCPPACIEKWVHPFVLCFLLNIHDGN